jgi:hypothetical protein
VAKDKGAFDAAVGDALGAFVQDCLVGAWVPWGECSASCGGGKRTRRRPVEVPAKNGGAKCGSTEEADACNTGGCTVQARRRHSKSGPS